jgi:hypothetical protein
MRIIKKTGWLLTAAIVLVMCSCGGAAAKQSVDKLTVTGFPAELEADRGDKVYFPRLAADGFSVDVSVNAPDGTTVEFDGEYFRAESLGTYKVYYTISCETDQKELILPVNVKEKAEVPKYFSREEGYIKKQNKRDFKILVLPDIQIIDPTLAHTKDIMSAVLRARYNDRDIAAFNMVRDLIENAYADFIVLLGDNVYGQFDDGSNFRALADLIDSYQIPWAYVNGNHDGETEGEGWGYDNQLSYIDTNTDYCMYVRGSVALADSYGNYVINILEDGAIAYSMYFLDTHGAIKTQGIYTEQVEWYDATVRAVNAKADKAVESLLFFHIPILQFRQAMAQYTGNGNTTAGVVPENSNGDFGINGSTSSILDDNGLWQAIKSLGGTKGIFCGHNHHNSASVMYQGVRLTYGLKTGYYDGHTQGMLGGTMIRLAADTYELGVSHIYLA